MSKTRKAAASERAGMDRYRRLMKREIEADRKNPLRFCTSEDLNPPDMKPADADEWVIDWTTCEAMKG